MEPNSIGLLVVLFAAAVGALFVLVRYRNLLLRLAAGALALVLAGTGGMAMVNDYYGYYQSWSELSADVSGNYSAFDTGAIGTRSTSSAEAGRVVSLDFAGRRSGISRRGYVYLPPQYFQQAYARTRFPVVELLHGSPSYASSWLVHLHGARVADELIAEHLMGPMILVMPSTYSGTTYEECLNSSRGLDDTYLTDDVRADVEKRFRATLDPAQWALVGVSSGGYCAANLGLRHRADFGAIGILSGYFRPQDGPAAGVLGHDPAAEAANSPLREARSLSSSSSPVPAFWLSAGTGNKADIAGAQAFAAALHGVQHVVLYYEPGGQHNFYAFAPAFDRVLPWVWTQIAPPNLRVRFPIAGPVTRHSVPIAPTQVVHGAHHRNRSRHRPPSRLAASSRNGQRK